MRDSLPGFMATEKPILRSFNFSRASRGLILASILGAGVLLVLSDIILGLSINSKSVVIATSLYTLAALTCAFLMHRTYPHDAVGLCNLVTLARLVLVGVLLVATLEGVPPSIGLLALVIVSLCLDGVDGWIARRTGLTSAFGARFDVEVDAAFALLLAVYAARIDVAGLAVLLLGMPHYVFWLARTLLPWLNAALPERFSRKAVCVLQIGTLIALTVPYFTGAWLELLVMSTALALVWSFGRDIRWLYRNRS